MSEASGIMAAARASESELRRKRAHESERQTRQKKRSALDMCQEILNFMYKVQLKYRAHFNVR